MPRVLFILKRRDDFDAKVHTKIGLSTGLYNSANFMHEMLLQSGIESRISVVPDNNFIDREVSQFKPTHVIIEALWVVPSKFFILSKLHPNVTWIVRLHSEMPFIASEGIAMDWLADYVRFPNLIIGVNAPRMLKETKLYLQTCFNWTNEETNRRVVYMPNFYPQEYASKKIEDNKDHIDISCFGAVRPLKNHLVQALAAVKFAESINKKLRFHINASRIEMKGEPVINNLKGFFQQLADKGHQLISHQWRPREEFLELCQQMDIGMQVSFSETFNIVGADHISQGIPLVTSNEIPWCVDWFSADPTNSEDIFRKLQRSWKFAKINVSLNQIMLTSYTNETRQIWIKYFTDK